MLHLRHHHAEEHTKIIDQIARAGLVRDREQHPAVDQPSPGPSTQPAPSHSPEQVVIKTEPMQIKIEVEDEGGESSAE